MKELVVLTGAGISAESGLKTFRDSDGLWENYRIEDVATPNAWRKDRQLVLDFYNQRRRQVLEAFPNKAHEILVELEQYFNVRIITQNIDNLHERAGSKNIIHLHGEIIKSRSTADPELIYHIEGWELKDGDRCEKGSQLRPHIVWFGEEVPMMQEAAMIAETADVLLIVGTSLQVYPAASLVNYINPGTPVFCIDPQSITLNEIENLVQIREKATTGLEKLKDRLIKMA